MKTLTSKPDSPVSFWVASAKFHLIGRHLIGRHLLGLHLLGLHLLGQGRFRRAIGLSLGLAAIAATVGNGAAFAQQAAPVAQTVLVADFNYDGIPDVLVESSTAPTATIAFGSVPYGTFGGNSKAVTFPTDCIDPSAGALAVGDFNGDGFPDIAFFCGTTAGTMLGKGDGTFAAPATLTGAGAGPAVVGDFNKDGKLDIAVLVTTGNSTLQQTIQLLLGNGDGTFNEAVFSALTVSTYTSIVAADLNADRYPDLLLMNSTTGATPSVEVLGNNTDGTFGVAAQGGYAANTVASVATTGAATILVGNFFGVASTDVAVTGTGVNGEIFAFKNTSTATAYSFSDPVTIPVANLTGAKAGKITGSAFTDLAVSNGTSIAVLSNDGAGNFAANYPTLTLASTASTFAVADANSDGYADIYTASLPATGALQLGVSLTTGSATATSQPFSLTVGTKTISAAWVGNVNFAGSTATGSQIVVGLPSTTAIASSKNPSLQGDSVIFTVQVAPGANSGSTQAPTGTVTLTDGTATLASGAIDGNGGFTFATAALTQATHTITATYSGDALYAASTATVAQVVNRSVVPTVVSFTPTTAALGSAATTITVTGANFDNNAVVQVNGTAIPTTVVSATTLTATIPASYFTTVGTLAITVFNPAGNAISTPASFTVTAALPAATLVSPPTTEPGTQPTLTLSLAAPYPVDITATVTLSFAPSITPAIDDPSIVFAATGSRTENIAIPAGTTTVPPILLQAGTVAGTITVPITLTAGGVNVTPGSLVPGVIVVPAAVPTVSSVKTTRSGKQLTVVMHGFSNTREIVNAKFHFTPAAGADLGTTDLTVLGDTIFNIKWFQTTGSYQYGSTFTYTQIFDLSDDATTVGAVDVTLSNSVGGSEMKNAQ